MKLIFSYLDDAYDFSPREKQIIIKLLDFFKDYIPNGNGVFLYDLNINKIKFKWCPEFAIPQTDQSGLWNIFKPNTIFIKPSTQSQAIYNLAKENISKNDQKINDYKQIISYKEQLNKQKKKVRLIAKDEKNIEDLIFIDHIIGLNVLSTAFHELYHKWQCKVTYLFPYLFNMLIGLIYGYHKSAQSKWFIQGDVRRYIDVPQLHQAISQFYSYFNTYVTAKAFIINNQKQFSELAIKSYLTSQQQFFIERYQDSIFIINDYKNSYNKLKKFVFQLCKFCEQL